MFGIEVFRFFAVRKDGMIYSETTDATCRKENNRMA